MNTINIACVEREQLYTLIFPCLSVHFDGLDEFDFVAHKAVDFSEDWTISERTTGFFIASGKDWIAAQKAAGDRLSKVTPEKIRAGMTKAREMYRATPNEISAIPETTPECGS